MTPSPSYDAIVNVYLPLLGVSLGYVTVGGYWQEQPRTNPLSWRQGRLPVPVTWLLQRAPAPFEES